MRPYLLIRPLRFHEINNSKYEHIGVTVALTRMHQSIIIKGPLTTHAGMGIGQYNLCIQLSCCFVKMLGNLFLYKKNGEMSVEM